MSSSSSSSTITITNDIINTSNLDISTNIFLKVIDRSSITNSSSVNDPLNITSIMIVTTTTKVATTTTTTTTRLLSIIVIPYIH